MYEELIATLRESRDKRMLDAADAIEELAKDLERSKNYEKFWNKEAEEALRRFQVAIANKPRWIPVTETPPRKVGDDGYNGYLVYANGYYEVADYTTDKFDNVPYFHVDGEYEPDVTHWMQLPQPPKEKK